MKPRPTIKNYHNSNAPPYQNSQTSSTPTLQALRDIDLVKLGLDLDDMPNLQASNSAKHTTNQDEIVKCLQAIYGKSSTDILQKLPSLDEWPMQSVSPPDYSRIPNNNNNNNNTVSNSVASIHANSGSGNDATSFNTISNSTSNNIKQDLQFANSQTSSAINQQFRVSSSNIHSPQQQQQQQQQQQLPPQQQKSVLSLHQHHQNEFSNRRLNHHHHHHPHLSTTSASFANLNTVSATNTTSTAAPSTLDTNNLNTLSGDIISSKNPSLVVGPHVSNIMDSLGSMDDLFYDSSIMINKDSNTSSNQQSLMKHQQLQKLLKVKGSQLISASTPSSTTMQSSHRNESQSQRNLLSNNMSQSQHQLSSPASTISPPQPTAFSSVPKSLLNLAACSSSTPTSTNTSTLPAASKYSSMVSQLSLMSARHSGNNISGNNSKSLPRNAININNGSNNHHHSNELSSQKGTTGNDLSNSGFHQSINRYTATSSSQTIGSSTKSNSKQPLQVSLLSEDQLGTSRNNPKTSCNVNSGAFSRLFSQSQGQNFSSPSTSRDTFLANLQERAARAGVSIGEITKPGQMASASNTSTSLNNSSNNSLISNHKNTINISPNPSKDDFINTVDRKEIESALSRVGARNDLSLLYPPLLLASNSQKQINALSAGLQGTDDSELFTKEVKKIVLEECNIIYECKECNNLFRSLANLVKHKRTYCTENHSGRNNVDLNKRQYTSTSSPEEQRPTTTPNVTTLSLSEFQESELDNELDCNQAYISRSEDSTPVITCNSDGRKNNLSSMIRLIQNQDSRNQETELNSKLARLQKNHNNKVTNVTNLSKLLKSQPKNRLPVSRDSALLDALNIPSSSTVDNNRLFTFEGDKNINCSEMNEQLVRNSSLAKTLLNEKVRVNNPRQSLIELSKAETSLQRSAASVPKRAPKRKFLEDCIKKVKRDKLFTEEDEEDEGSQPQSTINMSTQIVKPSDLHQTTEIDPMPGQGSALKSNSTKLDSVGDSDVDSNMLMIDLESPKKKTPPKKTKKRTGIASNSPLASNKLGSSSALLKALTRPVDKRTFNASTSTNEESSQQQASVDSNEEDSHQQPSLESNEGSSHHQEATLESDEDQSKEKEELKMDLEEDRLKLEAPSPLFDKQTCDICEVDHDDLESLLDHIVKKHTDQKMVYPCIFCSFSFITLENVCRHILDIHQKPKAQVHRLKEVVRSRSYISSDFLACSDHPALSVEEEEISSISTAATEDSELPEEEEASTKSKDTSEESSQMRAEPRVSNSGKHISASESQGGPMLSPVDNDSSSENYAESDGDGDGDGVDYDSTPPHDSDKEETLSDLAKQDNQQKPPSVRSTSETTPSASSTSAGGGIMKLKIQLKTRPDEKSKVYEIV